MNKRKKIDNKLYETTRRQAYGRDNGLCVLCGAVACEVHHIVFRSQMGTSELSNLACVCRDCHNEAHGVKAKEIRKILQERIKQYEED